MFTFVASRTQTSQVVARKFSKFLSKRDRKSVSEKSTKRTGKRVVRMVAPVYTMDQRFDKLTLSKDKSIKGDAGVVAMLQFCRRKLQLGYRNFEVF